MVIDDVPRGSTDDKARQFPGVIIHRETLPGVFSSADGTLIMPEVQKCGGVLTGEKLICEVAS